jgi:hypothetical protein
MHMVKNRDAFILHLSAMLKKTCGTFLALCGIKGYAIICKNGILSLTLYKKEKAIFTKLMVCRFYTT